MGFDNPNTEGIAQYDCGS